jgi:hypothetical protein
MVNCIESV